MDWRGKEARFLIKIPANMNGLGEKMFLLSVCGAWTTPC